MSAPGEALGRGDQVERRRGLDRETVEVRVLGVLRVVAIVFFLAITILPFAYAVMLSIRPIESVAADPGQLYVPLDEWTSSAYRAVLRSVDDGGQGFLTFLRNSAVIAVAAVALSLAVALPGAYALARIRFFGHRQVGALFLAVYLLPAILLAIPLFVVFSKLGLRGSLFGLVLVYTSQTVPISIYLLRNYLQSVPESLEEAAALDGCSRLQTIRHVIAPLSRPALMATSLFVFMTAWNEFLFALLFLVDDRDRWTVSLGLSQLSGSIEVPTTVLMAGSIILTVPIILVFLLAERLLVEGLTAGAEKG